MKIIKIDNKSKVDAAIKIYNSNTEFLVNHLGKNHIDEEFIVNEIKEMEEHGFISNLILEDNNPIGIIDYMLQSDRKVYLSLLMLDYLQQKSGKGKEIYHKFEKQIVDSGAKKSELMLSMIMNLMLFLFGKRWGL